MSHYIPLIFMDLIIYTWPNPDVDVAILCQLKDPPPPL